MARDRGDLDADRLAVAAHAGDAAAQAALGDAAPPPIDDLRDWVLALEAWGVAPCLIAGRAACEALREARDRGEVAPGRIRISRQAEQAAADYVACPCADHERTARVGWTRDAPWAYEFSWGDLTAEVVWDAAQRTGAEEAVRQRAAAALRAWALDDRALGDRALDDRALDDRALDDRAPG